MNNTNIGMTIEDWLGTNNKLGIDIWFKKYRNGNESFEQWLERISNGDAVLKQLIREKKFLFGGRILSNRGLQYEGRKVSYSNCYVISPPEDNLESIFETASKLARTFSYGGGCGVDISKLSPKGAAINNAAKETSGSVSFMTLFNLVTDIIGQNGRRGALMISLDCNHPDIEEFISVKNDLEKITKANISVRITDDFMRAVANGDKHTTQFIRKETGEVISKKIDAKELFKKLCENNWNFAEPGILFWDRINEFNLLSNDPEFEYAGVNPCAEEPLPAGGSCLLGSLNLSEFYDRSVGYIDYNSLGNAVNIAVRALNDVLDEGLSLHPLREQQNSVDYWRQIGLGIFGLADLLIKLKVPYGSKRAVQISEELAGYICDVAIRTSAKLAEEKGPYPGYKKECIEKSIFLKLGTIKSTKEMVMKYGLRNSQLLTIAPTGSLSTMLGVSGGIEPIYDTHYVRKTESLHGEDVYYNVYTPIVEAYMKEHYIDDVAELPDWFVTAKAIEDPKQRIDMQAAWQMRIDASISSTVNLPETATVEDVMELYQYAWNRNLKGLTIYRDNCARSGILTTEQPKEEVQEIQETKSNKIIFDKVKPITRTELGSRLSGSTYIKEVACGKLYITINRDTDDNLVEVFIEASKSGGCSANAECLGRYASACMRGGLAIDSIIDVTKGVRCSACTQFKGANKHIDGISCGDVVAKTILEEYELYHNKNTNKKKPSDVYLCKECGTHGVKHEGGCSICLNCGYSKCD